MISLKMLHFTLNQTLILVQFIIPYSFLDVMVADWEYEVRVASWDELLKPQDFEKRLQAFNSVNSNKNVVSFQWCFFMIVEGLCKAMVRNGYSMDNIMQWAGVQVFKKEQKSKRGISFAFDLILVAEMGNQINRLKHLVDKDLPLADANILFAFEGPKARKDVQDNPINPARKPWQVFASFLQQFFDGGRIFSMMDGLGAIGQAALSLGGYEVFAFEKNRDMWQEAQTILYDHILQMETQQKSLAGQSYFTCCYLLFLDSRNYVEIKDKGKELWKKMRFIVLHLQIICRLNCWTMLISMWIIHLIQKQMQSFMNLLSR